MRRRGWRVASGRWQRIWWGWLRITSLLVLLWPVGRVWAHDPSLHPDQILGAIGFDQRLDAQVPLKLPFRDETGHMVTLGDYFRDKPV